MADVYYVPGLKSNLLSAGHLLRNGFDIHFRDNTCFLLKNNLLVARIVVAKNNLFPLRLQTSNLLCLTSIEKNSKLQHDRYGHLNYESLKLFSSKSMVEGLPQINHIEDVCECQIGKLHRHSLSFTFFLACEETFATYPLRYL